MRNSVCHSATIYANAIMHAGTTVDTFLRENLVHSYLAFITSFFIDDKDRNTLLWKKVDLLFTHGHSCMYLMQMLNSADSS